MRRVVRRHCNRGASPSATLLAMLGYPSATARMVWSFNRAPST